MDEKAALEEIKGLSENTRRYLFSRQVDDLHYLLAHAEEFKKKIESIVKMIPKDYRI